LRRDFWEVGFELFRDRKRFWSHFLEADVLADGANDGLKDLDGKMDVIYAGLFLHLFDYAGQRKVCERIVRLLKPVKDSVVLGRQVGYVVAGEKVHRTNYREKMFRHNEESFRRMWEEVGDRTGTRWRVEVELKEIVEDRDSCPSLNAARDPDMRGLRFTVFRE
jgi:hypothetical protein